MKKVLALALSTAVIVSSLAGCGQTAAPAETPDNTASEAEGGAETPSESSDGVTINVISSDDFAGFRQEVIKEFTEETGINVNFVSVGYSALHQKEVTAFASGADTYDVVDVDCIWTPEYVENGYLECIDDRLTDEQKEGIIDVAMDVIRYQDKVYGLPMFNDVDFMYYNKDILNRGGFSEPPKTWDEFTEVCLSLQEQGLVDYGTSWGWAQAEGLVCFYLAFVETYGGHLTDENGVPTLNTPENVEALTYMVDSLYESEISAPSSITDDDRGVINNFGQGNIAFASSWSFAWGEFNDESSSKVTGNVGVMQWPGTSRKESATCAGSMGLAITSTSTHKDEAWQFIEFLASKDIQKRQAIEAGALPIWADLYTDPDLVASQDCLPDMLKQLETAVNRPSLVWYNEFSDVLQIELQNALTQAKSPQETLDDAQEQVMAIMENQ